MIAFPSSIEIPILNHLTDKAYSIVRGDQVTNTDERVAEIVRICNEPAIYRWLFSSGLKGQPYTKEKAIEWLTWSAEGWRANTHFCFIALDSKGAIVAACDIKSADVNGAEVGYWASSAHRGIMTNIVTTVIREAAKAGFMSLMARAQYENVRSKNVMTRVGFLPDPASRDESRDYFTISLDS